MKIDQSEVGTLSEVSAKEAEVVSERVTGGAAGALLLHEDEGADSRPDTVRVEVFLWPSRSA
jgi:hypothetical protein